MPTVPAAPSQAEQVVRLLEDLEHAGAARTPAALDVPPPLSPEIAEALTARWTDLQAMLDWWQERQRHVHEADDPAQQLERQTYHVQRRFIALIKREADLQETTYAAIVNRAFAQYFAARST